ncbi:MAG: MFS transporter [Thermodesulfobacteriota bacterium]
MKKESPSHIHWAWIILGVSFITLFINYSIRIGAYSILLPKMIPDLRINLTQAGMIRSSYFIAYILCSPLMGWLTDRIGARWVISFFSLILGGGTFLMGKASSLSSAILFHAIVGVGASAMWTPIVVMVQKWFGAKKRGLALGILSPSYALGYGLMGMILPFIVEAYQWRMGWTLLGLSCIGLVFLNGSFLRNDPREIGIVPWRENSNSIGLPTSPSSPPYKEIFRGKTFWYIGISYLLISFGAYILTDLIVAYGVMELKIPYPISSRFITILAFSGIGGGIFWMALSDYLGRKRSLLLINTSVALSIFLILFVGREILSLRIAVGIFGFFYSPIWPMYGACARDYFPKEMVGSVIGLLTFFYGIGAILGPILAGKLVDLTATFRWSFSVGASACLLATLMISFLQKPKKD